MSIRLASSCLCVLSAEIMGMFLMPESFTSHGHKTVRWCGLPSQIPSFSASQIRKYELRVVEDRHILSTLSYPELAIFLTVNCKTERCPFLEEEHYY